MKAALVLFAAVTLARGAECPPLTCEQLKQKMTERCPATETAATANAPQATSPAAVPCEPIVKVVEKVRIVETTQAEKGDWLLGAGPVYQAGWGIQGVVGYDWGKVQLLVGPNWITRNGQSGSVGCNDSLTRHDSHGDPGGGGCVPGAYQVPPPSSWGGVALAVFRLR